jgi:uncharacterized membrane protein
MDILETVNNVVSFIQANLYLSLAGVLVLLIVLFKISRFLFTFLLIVLLLAGVVYLISDLTSTGTSYKKEMMDKKVLPTRDRGGLSL